MKPKLVALSMALALTCAFRSVNAATITIRYSTLISIQGEIDSASPQEFESVLASTASECRVMLDSLGGDLTAALAIGRMIRARSCKTTVIGNASCASACIFILASGVDREVYSDRIGIHRPHFDDEYFAGLSAMQARDKYHRLEDDARGYLSEMGMPDELFVRMMRIASSNIQWLGRTEIDRLGLAGSDPAYEEWLRAQYVRRFGPDGYRRHLEGIALFSKCINEVPGNPNADPKCQRDVTQRYPETVWSPSPR